MTISGSRKTQEMRQLLALQFSLDEDTVSRGLAAIVGALHPRIPKHLGVALASWFPESWPLLEHRDGGGTQPARGIMEFKQRVYEAGVPFETAGAFIAAAVEFLSERCGKPLAEALTRKVPEISALRQEAGKAPSSSPVDSSSPETPVLS